MRAIPVVGNDLDEEQPLHLGVERYRGELIDQFGMLARVQLFSTDRVRIDAAMVLIALSGLYYLALEWRLGLAMIAVSAAFYAVGYALPMSVNVAFFVLGWILQFVGHTVYEKRQPAFVRNLVHLLIGPLWILNDIIPVVKPTAARGV